ncbi:MAG: hypothetical protein ACFFCI_06400 [Promethearchaeota archaeon]
MDLIKNKLIVLYYYIKIYGDAIFDQPTRVEPIESPLTGGTLCRFAVYIPKKFQK